MSSLFAGLGSASKPQGSSSTGGQSGFSLFGNPASTSGSTTNTPQSQTGQQSKPFSLFGGVGGQSGQQQPQGQQQTSGAGGGGGGLFGGAQSTTASSGGGGGLFGGGNSTSTSGGGGGGLFGGAASAKPTGTGSNLFGSIGSQPQQQQQQPQQQQSSLFQSSLGGNNNANPEQARQESVFAQLDQFKSDPSAGQSTGGQEARATQAAYFDSLLERSKKRKNESEVDGSVERLGEMPSLELGLGDISRRLKGLRGEVVVGQPKEADSKAHYLLAASGIRPGSALRDLQSFNAQAGGVAAQHAPPAFDTDIDAYVSNLQSQSTLALIEEGLNRSAKDFDAFVEENVTMEWDAQRRRIYEHFGLVPKGTERSDDTDTSFASPAQSEMGMSFGRSSRRGRAQKKDKARPGPPGATASFGASSMQRSLIGSPGPTGVSGQGSLFADVPEVASGAGPAGIEDRFAREKQIKFAERVQRLNQSRLQDRVYPILREFAEVEAQAASSQETAHFVDAYNALIEITGEDPTAGNVKEPNAVKERQFMDDYLDEAPNSKKTLKVRERIIEGSRRFLEKHFFNQLESVVGKNPREARLGGVPTILSKVRAYVTLRSARKDLVSDNTDLQTMGGEHCWAIIFYLLRSGHLKEAVEYVEENASGFRAIDRNFPQYLTLFYSSPDGRLRRNLQDRIQAEYSQRSRIAPENSIDPYRMACYKLIGRCELNKRNLDILGQGVEDWIWLQFALAREVNRVDEVAGEVFGLEEIREVIREIGQRHFGKGASEALSGQGTYFFLQILCGMFESAVSFLYPFSYLTAVHFAISLDFYGLLRVGNFDPNDSDLLTYNTKRMPQISFGRMLGYYTRDFRSANVEAAVDYLTLICLNADLPGPSGKSQSSLCHEALRELVLETREFAQLLGDIRSDGRRIQGAIERRLKLIRLSDQEEFLRTVTIQAARVADDNGRTTDAVLLYHLAEQYDNVIAIINRSLSEAIAVEIGQDQLRLQPLKPRLTVADAQQQPSPVQDGSSLSLTSVDDPAELARNMISLYNSNALYFNKIKQTNRDACGVLLQMSEAKRRVEVGKWAEALDIIQSLSLLPLTSAGDIHQIRALATAASHQPSVISRNIGVLLMWTITCCGRQREVLRGSAFGATVDPTRRAMADDLALKARDLMVFAGLVKSRLSPRVFEVLARAGQEVESW
ncbi:MAG: hypothetical protein M4579_003505 [Chaenotheca gracillima]|nr:MAG: hypothetical protein M4579_003505 [Chaenotheca gracillima]